MAVGQKAGCNNAEKNRDTYGVMNLDSPVV